MPSMVSIKDLRAGITTKRQYNQAIKDLRSATAKSLAPTGKKGKGKSEYLKRMDKRARARKTKTVLTEAQQKQQLRQKALSDIRIDKKPGRFPTDRDFILKNMGLTEGGMENYERFKQWLNVSPSKSMQWRQNYLKALENVMDGAMASGNDEAVASLEELHKKISSMDIEDFLIGQLVNPAGVEISYIYPHRGEGDNELANRINRIISDWDNIYG